MFDDILKPLLWLSLTVTHTIFRVRPLLQPVFFKNFIYHNLLSSFKATVWSKPRQQRREKLFHCVSNLEWENSPTFYEIFKILNKCEFSEVFRLQRKLMCDMSQSWGAPPDLTREVCPDTKVDISLQGLQKSNDKLFSSIHIFPQRRQEELADCWRSCSGWNRIQRQVEDYCQKLSSHSSRHLKKAQGVKY